MKININQTNGIDNIQDVTYHNSNRITGYLYCCHGNIGEFINGKPVGKINIWGENGGIKSTREFDTNSMCVASKGWYNNGEVSHEVTGLISKTGVFSVTSFYENGGIQGKQKYKNGYEDGTTSLYFESGLPMSEITYKEGLLHGKNIHYFENGQLRTITPYIDDIAEGDYICFYENGNIQRKGKLKGASPIGEWNYYNEDGTFLDTKFISEIENAMQSMMKMPSERKMRKNADRFLKS
jgi:antitoxin component YwqK of YwqJK toxin-antitoxin module